MRRLFSLLAGLACVFLLIATAVVSGSGQPVLADGGTLPPETVAPGTVVPTEVPCGTISGVVTDASTGNPLGAATVSVLALGASTVSNPDGSFAFLSCLPAGPAQLSTVAQGYGARTDDITIPVDGNVVVAISLVPFSACSEGQGGPVTFVLTWGEQNSDLDSHLSAPGGYHVWYGDPNPADFVSLDVDDVTYMGPETITIATSASAGDTFVAGDYEYWIHNYSQQPGFAGSGAVVTISQCGSQVAQYAVADATGDPEQKIWRVVSITLNDNGIITAVTPRGFFADGDAGTIFP